MKVTASCTIKAKKTDVFAAFSDVKNLANHVEAIKNIELLTSGKVGVGTKFKETRVMFGKESSETMEITEFAPPEYFIEEAHSNGMHYKTEWRFTEQDSATTVSVNFSGKPSTIGARFMNIMFAFMSGGMKKAFLADMKDLKNKLENK